MAAAAIAQRAAAFASFAAADLATEDDPRAAILHFIGRVIEHLEEGGFCGGAPLAAVALETAATSARLRNACADAYAQLHAPFIAKLTAGGYSAEAAASLALFINAAMEGAVVLSRAQRTTNPLRQVHIQVGRLLDCQKP